MKKLFIIATTLLAAAACSHKSSHEHHHDHQQAAESAVPKVTKAHANLQGAEGTKVKGMVHFTEENGVVKVEAMFDGVKPGPHGFHIHETGDCSAKDFTSAGGHFNPAGHKHAGTNPPHHAGDFGNVMADKKGNVKAALEASDITLGEGPNSIIGKAVVLHADKDDLKSQPAGNAGKRIGCGVIEAL